MNHLMSAFFDIAGWYTHALRTACLAGMLLLGCPQMTTAQQSANEKGGRLFFLDFEKGFTAAARGKAIQENAENLPRITKGVLQKGAAGRDKSFLEYESENNFNPIQGTISIWVQLPVAEPGKWYYLFKNTGIIDGESAAISLAFSAAAGFKMGIGNRKDAYITAKPANNRKRDEWHQVAISWNINRGISIYMDGVLAATRLTEPWKPDLSQFFTLGGAAEDGYESWNAAWDEVSIFDTELTEKELFASYSGLSRPVTEARLVNPFLNNNTDDSVSILLLNRSDKAVAVREGILAFEVKGKPVQCKLQETTIAATQHVLLKIPVPAQAGGKYPFSFCYRENEQQNCFSDTIYVLPAPLVNIKRDEKRSLIKTIDANAGVVAESVPSKVIHSKTGAYREAGGKRHDRFALDFSVSDVDKAHVAVISYPDDKPRSMEIILQDLNGHQDYQAQTGVITGDEYPVSDSIKTIEIIFWPKSQNQSFIFMTAENGRPAAVNAVAVYKLEESAVASLKGKFSGKAEARETGIYYEDPVLNLNFGEKTDISGFEKSANRLFSYMQSFGQTVLSYPVVWYNGPLYTSALSFGQGNVGGARPHPTGYVHYLLKSLHQRGMKFNASLHLHTLPALEQVAVTSKELVAKGAETVLNVRCNGSILFNRFHGSDPSFNPIDSTVQNHVTGIVCEVAEQFGGEPAFEGITLVIARVKLFGFGSLESGYNDVNLQRFQKETGIAIPAYNKMNASRFADAYKWMMTMPAAKQAWINWRCKKIYEYYKGMADKLSAYRKDLKLTLNIFLPVAVYSRLSGYLKEDATDIMRETGFDPRLYQDANLVLSFTEVPADYRLKRSFSNGGDEQIPYRTVFTAPAVAESLHTNPVNGTGVIVHDRYWEDDIGKTAPLKFSGYSNAAECKWRVSTLNPAGIHSLEPYVFALNYLDATSFVKGGFLIGTMGMEPELTAFSTALQQLPAVKFDDVKALADPVRVRQKWVDGELFFYVLNCLPAKVNVNLTLNKKAVVYTPGTDSVWSASGIPELNLEPYELKVFKSNVKDLSVTGGKMYVNAAWLAELKARFSKIKEEVVLLGKKQGASSSYLPYYTLAEKCLQEEKYARLYFLLQEGWVSDIHKQL